MDLTEKKCVPCEGGIPAFTEKQAKAYLKQIRGWKLVKNKIEKNLEVEDFVQALKFVNKVADLAEEEQHHPDILIHSWNKVKITLYTHVINGLSENDFILAAKIDKLL